MAPSQQTLMTRRARPPKAKERALARLLLALAMLVTAALAESGTANPKPRLRPSPQAVLRPMTKLRPNQLRPNH